MTAEFHPADDDSGIVFVRKDLPGQPRIPAIVHNRVQGPRRTTLVHDGCAVELVEHVMAALAGMQIDNCEVHVDHQEIPGCDGSSLPFVRALIDAGRESQVSDRAVTVVESITRVGDEKNWVEARPNMDNAFKLTYELDYPHCRHIGEQSYTATVTPDRFVNDIAPARTFLLEQEANQLKEKSLGLRVTYQDVVVFGDQGVIENQLLYPDECARHKLLDMVGDLALIGTDLVGTFVGSKSGHHLNAEMAFALIQQVNSNKNRRLSA